MEFKNFEDIIRFAVQREEEAARFYMDLSARASNPGIRDMLLELREEEEKHKNLLMNLSEEKMEGRIARDVTDLKISDYLLEEPLDTEMNFQDLLIFAAKKEEKAAELYSELAARAGKEESRSLFEFLVSQEKTHKLILETEYEKHVLSDD